MQEVRAAIEKAKAWTEGFMFAYYMERGWDVPEALEKARSASPDHLTQLVPGWNPYDPSPRFDDDADEIEDVDYDTVHITKPDGSCVISINGQGHLPCTKHSEKGDSEDA